MIFGRAGTKAPIYQTYKSDLEIICSTLNIEEIYDIGPPAIGRVDMIGAIPVSHMERCESPEASRILLDSFAGIIDYPCKRLAKSSVFASYCAHGMLPINTSSAAHEVDSLLFERDYLTTFSDFSILSNIDKIEEIADSAFSWHVKHRSEFHAALFFNSILETS